MSELDITLRRLDVPCPELGGKIVLRAVTRGQVREARAFAVDDEGKEDADTLDLAILAFAFAEPDLVRDHGLEGAVSKLRGLPWGLSVELVGKAVLLGRLRADSPFPGATPDDVGRLPSGGPSDSPRVGDTGG